MASLPSGLWACQLNTHEVDVISVIFGAKEREKCYYS
jgi:hypothetical protein